jgi:hypothetical protein
MFQDDWVWLQALGFQSAQNPGRMIRVLHTLVRTVLVTFRVSCCRLSIALLCAEVTEWHTTAGAGLPWLCTPS